LPVFRNQNWNDRKLPGITALMLASNRDLPRAPKFLALRKKDNLLSEERKLVEKAQLTVAR